MPERCLARCIGLTPHFLYKPLGRSVLRSLRVPFQLAEDSTPCTVRSRHQEVLAESEAADGVSLWLSDLRHTVATKMAEARISDPQCSLSRTYEACNARTLFSRPLAVKRKQLKRCTCGNHLQ
jgi:hypothetical protein